LVPPFEVGRYAIRVYDVESNRLIYACGFDTTFAEYKTTTPALKGEKRVLQKSVHLPMPRKQVRVEFEQRNKANHLTPLYHTIIDPTDYHIIRETVNQGDWTFEIQKTGPPHERVDFAFLSEGYTASEKEKFKGDAERFARHLFTVEPYKSSKDKFNVYGVFRPSAEQGVDQPRQHSFKNTILGASYNSFDLDRYLLVENNHAMHRMAAQVPYDTVVVLVNSSRYGGGSIAMDYCVTTVDNSTSLRIFLHELGHSFAFLADEYVGSVAYNDFHPKGVEPLEPNITALLDPSNIKWKHLLTPGIALPTEPPPSDYIKLKAQLRAAQSEVTNQVAAATAKGQNEEEIKGIEDKSKALQQELENKIAAEQAKIASFSNIVGAFEGAGYMSKGMYRAQYGCWMGGAGPADGFCAVCRHAIQRIINYYAGGAPLEGTEN
jgi:hypothetical protein